MTSFVRFLMQLEEFTSRENWMPGQREGADSECFHYVPYLLLPLAPAGCRPDWSSCRGSTGTRRWSC